MVVCSPIDTRISFRYLYYSISHTFLLGLPTSILMGVMNRIVISLAICSLSHSLAVLPRLVEDSIAQPRPSCSHDIETRNPVTAWPGDSWCAHALSITFQEPIRAQLKFANSVYIQTLNDISTSTPYPLSCLPNP